MKFKFKFEFDQKISTKKKKKYPEEVSYGNKIEFLEFNNCSVCVSVRDFFFLKKKKKMNEYWNQKNTFLINLTYPSTFPVENVDLTSSDSNWLRV